MNWFEFVDLTLIIHRMSKDGWSIAIKMDKLIFLHEDRGSWHFNDLEDCREFLMGRGYL